MQALGRKVEVLIGDERGEGLRFDERFRVSFDLTKTLEPDGSTGVVQIYNPSNATRDRLVKDAQFIVINAGYDGSPLEELFSGDVVRSVYVHERPDTFLEFEMVDAARALRDSRIALAFAAGTPIQLVLDAVLNRLDLPVEPSGFQVDGIYQQGIAFSGRARDALNKVTAKAGVTWSIQDGRVQLLRPDDPEVTGAVRLTPQTGLIASPEKLDDRESETEANKGPGYIIQSLLNPKIRPGSRLLLSAEGIEEAEFIIDAVSHTGDIRGNDWRTEAEVYEAP